MEDLIPLIIVIAISIIGAIGRKKKRNNPENISTPDQSVQSDDDFLSWFNKLNIVEDNSPVQEEKTFMEMIKSEIIPAKVTPVKEPVKKEEIPNIFSKYSGFISPEERENLMSKEGISTVKKRVISEGDLTNKTPIDSETIENKPKFEIDIRKAVIYNEILNPKYV